MLLDDIKLVLEGLDHTTRGMEESPVPRPCDATSWKPPVACPDLDKIYKAQAAGDYIAIADELEYDLPDQMTDWTELLAEARRASDHATSGGMTTWHQCKENFRPGFKKTKVPGSDFRY